MNELKPIETGCMAVTTRRIIKSNNGKFVTVGKLITEDANFCFSPRWEIDRPMDTVIGVVVYHAKENQLIRIDDPDLKEEEEEELLLIEDNA